MNVKDALAQTPGPGPTTSGFPPRLLLQSSACMACLVAFFFALTRFRGARPDATPAKAPSPPENCSSRAQPVDYDLRRGASAYAPIIGGIGGLVVPAVVLIFQIASTSHGAGQDIELGRATALLVLGLIGCLLGAFAFAAIGAEQRLTPNLTAATLYAGAATGICIVAIMAAFEALSQALLPSTKELFAWITGGTAIGAAVLVALVLGDAWTSAPDGHWLSSRKAGYRLASISSVLAALVLLGGTIASYVGLHPSIGVSETHWVVGLGIVLVLLLALGSTFRTMHGTNEDRLAIWKLEAIAALSVLVGYLLALILAMP